MQKSFGDIELTMRVKRDSAVMKAHALMDWERMRPMLSGLYKREESRLGGQEPMDPLLMFKATLLGQWHSLSDPKLEEALHVRIDFMHFCGLSLSDSVPDETTLCRFRNRLIQAGKLAPLLAAVNAQLQAQGLMVQNATGAVIDATLVASAARPRSQTTIEAASSAAGRDDGDGAGDEEDRSGDRGGDGDDGETGEGREMGLRVSHTSSVDSDATWLKKGAKSHYGYRVYTSVDAGEGFIRGVHSAPANQSETQHFAPTLAQSDLTPERVYADKGFASRANRAHLHERGIKSAIMHKAQRNRPLTARQRRANRRISKTRYIVEQGFATMKRLFGMARASYLGTLKVNAQFTLKAMCLNLLKAANKICLLPLSTGVVRPLSTTQRGM